MTELIIRLIIFGLGFIFGVLVCFEKEKRRIEILKYIIFCLLIFTGLVNYSYEGWKHWLYFLFILPAVLMYYYELTK
jgi:disulfide bond formation protein DsbB